MNRRVAVIGDLHTEHTRLEALLAHAEARSVDAVWCVGDIVDGLGDVDRTCDLLAERGVVCVAGNHERWFLAGEMLDLPNRTMEVSEQTRAFLAALPVTRVLPTPAGGAMLCHGVGDDDMALLRSDTKGYALQGIPTLRELMLDDAVVYMVGGHSHERMVRRFAGLTVVNAGTVHREWDESGYVLIDFAERVVQMFDFGEDGLADAGGGASAGARSVERLSNATGAPDATPRASSAATRSAGARRGRAAPPPRSTGGCSRAARAATGRSPTRRCRPGPRSGGRSR